MSVSAVASIFLICIDHKFDRYFHISYSRQCHDPPSTSGPLGYNVRASDAISLLIQCSQCELAMCIAQTWLLDIDSHLFRLQTSFITTWVVDSFHQTFTLISFIGVHINNNIFSSYSRHWNQVVHNFRCVKYVIMRDIVLHSVDDSFNCHSLLSMRPKELSVSNLTSAFTLRKLMKKIYSVCNMFCTCRVQNSILASTGLVLDNGNVWCWKRNHCRFTCFWLSVAFVVYFAVLGQIAHFSTVETVLTS